MITEAWLQQAFPCLGNFEKIGEGGQKWVLGASHSINGDVVLKLIKPGMNLDRVHREILAVRQVGSSRIPMILGSGIAMGSPVGDLVWMLEQRIRGKSLRELVTAGPMPPQTVLRIGIQVLEALVDVGRARIIHRDIKPDNIMIDANGDAWLLDFGIARHLDLNSLTATAAPGGPCTIGYAPPEQYHNLKGDITEAADLFALAVTLVECLSGKHPYRDGARDHFDVIRRIEGAPLPLPKFPWDREGRFTDLLAAMGQRRVDCRPQSIADALVWAKDLQVGFGW